MLIESTCTPLNELSKTSLPVPAPVNTCESYARCDWSLSSDTRETSREACLCYFGEYFILRSSWRADLNMFVRLFRPSNNV